MDLRGEAGRSGQVLHGVKPDVVVEISVDNSTDSTGRWRHIARYQRLRTDLTPDEVPRISRA